MPPSPNAPCPLLLISPFLFSCKGLFFLLDIHLISLSSATGCHKLLPNTKSTLLSPGQMVQGAYKLTWNHLWAFRYISAHLSGFVSALLLLARFIWKPTSPKEEMKMQEMCETQ